MVVGKRGFEVQFHWIFVMIAGVLILSFFVMLATKQRTLSEQKLQATLASDVESILVGALVSKGVAQSLPAIPQGLRLDCSAGCACTVNIGRASRSFENKAIFSPEWLKDRPSIVWSLDWKIPYRVMNFLFLTNPNIKYYLVYDESDPVSRSLYDQVSKNLPPPIQSRGAIVTQIDATNLSSEQVPSLEATDVDHTRFVFLEVPAVTSLDSSFRREDASAVRISRNPSPRVEFFEKDGATFSQTTTLAYAGLPTMYAAMFAQDSDMYKCGLRTAFKRFSYLANIYSSRAEELDIVSRSQNTSCNYSSLISLLGEQSEISSRLSISRNLDQSTMSRLLGLQSRVALENRRLVEQSCRELF